ncbi:WbqC family protein [Altibacter lentus]|uniref:WbqC family protein n=1 Tax=Altibacter lentus TaxID=1223410 RepID=UPI000551FC71|nr:WbqC family protein [Altibacter lentus]
MKEILIYPTYFPCIAQMAAAAQADAVVLELEDNYQKQTYRNRTYIAHNNGRLLLNVPVKHATDGNRQKTKDVVVENDFDWQKQHWRSIQTAYRTSPFFEFYEDELAPFFSEKVAGLQTHNLRIFKVLHDLLGMEVPITTTTEYYRSPAQQDLREMVNARREKKYELEPYTQVLEAHHGFLPNLSVLDLLCNEGPNALHYLEKQKLAFI